PLAVFRRTGVQRQRDFVIRALLRLCFGKGEPMPFGTRIALLLQPAKGAPPALQRRAGNAASAGGDPPRFPPTNPACPPRFLRGGRPFLSQSSQSTYKTRRSVNGAGARPCLLK